MESRFFFFFFKRSRKDATGNSLEIKPKSCFLTNNGEIKRVNAQNIVPFSKKKNENKNKNKEIKKTLSIHFSQLSQVVICPTLTQLF